MVERGRRIRARRGRPDAFEGRAAAVARWRVTAGMRVAVPRHPLESACVTVPPRVCHTHRRFSASGRYANRSMRPITRSTSAHVCAVTTILARPRRRTPDNHRELQLLSSVRRDHRSPHPHQPNPHASSAQPLLSKLLPTPSHAHTGARALRKPVPPRLLSAPMSSSHACPVAQPAAAGAAVAAATAAPDSLTARMRCPRVAGVKLPAAEPARTGRLLAATAIDPTKLQALARLWAVPRAALDAYETAETERLADAPIDWQNFYDDVIAAGDAPPAMGGGHGPDARLFRIMLAIGGDLPVRSTDDTAKCVACGNTPSSSSTSSSSMELRGAESRPCVVRPEVVAAVVRAALSRRGNPVFAKNMAAAVATVQFGISPDRMVRVYWPALLRRSGLCTSLRRFEVSNEMSGCFAGLESSKFVAMLRDLGDVLDDSKSRERGGFGPCLCAGAGGIDCDAGWVSVGAALRYSDRRDLLTRRAVQAVCKRHGRNAVVERADCVRNRPCDCKPEPRKQDGSTSSVSSSVSSEDGPCASHHRSSTASRSTLCRCAVEKGLKGSVVGSVASLVTMDCDDDVGGRSPPNGNEPFVDGASDTECTLAELDDEEEEDMMDVADTSSSYTRSKSLSTGSIDAMSGLDFVRLYLALVRCGTDGGVLYWFEVLDVDGDGLISCADARHFYGERRREGERRLGGTALCEVESVWTRVCGSAGGLQGGYGDLSCRLSTRDVLRMDKSDREFLLCALLIRRVDDVQLVDAAATERLRQSEAFKTGSELRG